MLGILSPDRKFVLLTRIWGALGGANCSSTSSSHLTSKPSKYLRQVYTPEETVKMGRYGSENGPSKVTERFSPLLDGKLT